MSWHQPFPIAGPQAGKPGDVAAVSRQREHLDVFWIGPDGGVGSTWWNSGLNNGAWNNDFPIAPPGAAQGGAITAVARNPQHLDVFWIGPDGGVGSTWWDAGANNGRWNTPFPIAPPGAAQGGAISAVARNPQHLDVFWIGPDGGVGSTWWDAGANNGRWNTPFPIAPPGAAQGGAISAVARMPEHLDVFWVGPDGGIGSTWWSSAANNGRWNNPFPIAPPGAAQGGAVSAVARMPEHLDVFWVGPDGGIGSTWWSSAANNGRWNNPFPIAPPGAARAGAVSAVARMREHLDVFWVGPDGGIGSTWWSSAANNGRWNNPFPIAPPGAAQGGAVTAVARMPEHLDVFWVGPDGGIGSTWWHEGQRVRLFLKVLIDPTTFTIDDMVAAMRQVYSSVEIDVDIVGTERLDLPALNDVDVGTCSGGTITEEQKQLFANRNGMGANDLAIYFVRSTIQPFNGCANHPAGQPGAVVVSTASQWTLAHEVGHVLALDHVDDPAPPSADAPAAQLDRLMTGRGTFKITNAPPDLHQGERETMFESSYTV